MNGAHDLGGMHGFGPIAPEADEPVFHEEWERRCFAITLAMGFTGEWNIDKSRFAREQMQPGHYLETSYYEHWLFGLERLLADCRLVAPEEIEGRQRNETRPVKRILRAPDVASALAKGGPSTREQPAPPRFAPGDRVRARNMHPPTHTRIPRYVRGRVGEVALLHGAHVFPDTNALGQGESPQHCYSVRFSGRELWGPDGDPATHVHVDLWEPYLEPA